MAVTQGIDRLRTARYNRGMKNTRTTTDSIFPILMLMRELSNNYTPELFDNSFRLVQKLSPSCSGIS